MAKPVLTHAAVVAAARYVHLHGGSEVDLQALARRGRPFSCSYEEREHTPAHAKKLVCVVGAFFWRHGLLDKRVDAEGEDGVIPIGSVAANIGRLVQFAGFTQHVVVPDEAEMDLVRKLQALHDRAASMGEDLPELREALGLEPI